MDTPGRPFQEIGPTEESVPMPKNPFRCMQGVSDWEAGISPVTAEAKAFQFAARELERDIVSGQKQLVETLRFSGGSPFIRPILSGLSSKFSWLLALDEAFFPPHAMQMMCGGINWQPIFDDWNQLLSVFTAASALFQEMGVSMEGITTGDPGLMRISEYDRHLIDLEAIRVEIEALLLNPERDEKLLGERQLRYVQVQQLPFNEVDKNPHLMSLLYTRKDAVVGRLDHPVWKEIWAHPEFQGFYRKLILYYGSILRELTQQRLRQPTPEKVYEATFCISQPLSQHIDFIIDLANALQRRFMTSPQDVPGLPEGQKMIVLVTSDQRLQSSTELTEKIRTLAQQHGISLGDIDCRWNQEEPVAS